MPPAGAPPLASQGTPNGGILRLFLRRNHSTMQLKAKLIDAKGKVSEKWLSREPSRRIAEVLTAFGDDFNDPADLEYDFVAKLLEGEFERAFETRYAHVARIDPIQCFASCIQ